MTDDLLSDDDKQLKAHLGVEQESTTVDDSFVPTIPDDPDISDLITVIQEQNDSILALRDIVHDQTKTIEEKNQELAQLHDELRDERETAQKWRNHVNTELQKLTADEKVVKSEYYRNLTTIEQAVETADRDEIEDQWGTSVWRASILFRHWSEWSYTKQNDGVSVITTKANAKNNYNRSNIQQNLIDNEFDWTSLQLKRAMEAMAKKTGSEFTTKNGDPAHLGGIFETFKRYRDGCEYRVLRLTQRDELLIDPFEDV